MKAIQRLGMVLLAILAVAGIWATVQRFVIGMRVTDLTSNMAWGMWVAYYIYCIGLSAGSFLLSTLIYVFGMKKFEKLGAVALLSALFALFAGLVFVWIDLGHPWRFWKIVTGFQPRSVMAWEALLYVIYMVVICGELWYLLRFDMDKLAARSAGLKRLFYRVGALGWRAPTDPEQVAAAQRAGHRAMKVLGVIGIPVAIGVHGGTGALFAVLAAKPYWFSGLFPIIFLVSALLSGAGLMMFLYAFWGPRDEDYLPILYGLRQFMLGFIAIDAILFISDLLVGLYGGVPAHVQVLNAIFFGDYWYVFWLGQIGLAWLLPSLIGCTPGLRNRPSVLGAAGAMVVVGIVAVRLNLVIPAYLHPQLPGLQTAYLDPRLAYEYFPTLTEWVSSHGLFALFALAFIALWKLLPMFEAHAGSQSAVASEASE